MKLKLYKVHGCLLAVAAGLLLHPEISFGSVDEMDANGSASLANVQANPLTGGFSYAIPIKVAPGRQGAQPALALGYGSGGDNGWCGVGWALDIGFIQRDTRKGVPVQWSTDSATPLNRYDDSKGLVASIGGVGGLLVAVSPTNQNPVVYRQEVETSFLTYNLYNDSHWEVVDKSGNTFYFGQGATNRMDHPGWTANTNGSSFKWLLNKVIDVNGNQSLFSYATDDGQMYLTNILYNANTNSPTLSATHSVSFLLTNRSDTNISFQSGYRVGTGKLLSEIQVKVSGSNVRKYVLGYTNSTSTTRSLLASVTEYGSDTNTALPSLTFSYQVKPFEFEAASDWTNLNSQGLSTTALTNIAWYSVHGANAGDSQMLLKDIDGDGLPDRVMRLKFSPYTNYFMVQRNTGNGFAPTTTNYHWGPLLSPDTTDDWNSPVAVNDDNETHVELLDINGDGYPDRIWRKETTPYTNFFVLLNSGVAGNSGFASNTMVWGPVTNEETTVREWNSIRYAYSVDFIDFNGDGLPDRVSRKESTPFDRFKVQLNTGNGFTQPVDWYPLDSQGNTDYQWNSPSRRGFDDGVAANYKVLTIDMNGDGLPDRVMRKDGTTYTNFVVQFNNGAGFEAAQNWGPVDTQGNDTDPYWGSPISGVSGQIRATLVDINGDGLPDRVMRKQTTPYTNWVVQLNTGSGFAAAVNWGPVDSQGDTSLQWNNISYSNDNSDTPVDFLDINGDGLPDRVMRKHDSPYDRYVIQLNKGPFPDLLSTIGTGLGGKTEVKYLPSTTLDNRDKEWVSDPWSEGTKSLMPYNTWVVSQVSVSDGMGKTNRTTYSYKGGYYNSLKREFRGFSQVEVVDGLGTTNRTYFHQGGGRDNSALGEYLDQDSVAKRGVPFRIEVIGNDGLTNKITLNKVEEVLLHTNGWYFPFISQTIIMNYEGLSSYRATAKQLQYDTNNGNLSKDFNFGEVTNIDFAAHTFTDVGDDSVYTHFAYATNTIAKNKPANIKITSDSAGTLRLKESLLAYDSRGNVTNSQVWLDTAGAFINLASTSYDQYGNPLQTADASGITTTIIYDSTYAQYGVTQITGTFTNQFVHDPRAGSLIQGTDPKGLVCSNVYDVFFRTTETYNSTTANGAPTLWRTKMDYVLGGTGGGISTNYVRKRVNDAVDAVNGYETYSYSDGLGRAIQSRAEAENGVYRVTDMIYDERGNVKYQTLAYTNSSSSFTTLSGTKLGTFTEFDAIGRSFKVTPAVEATFTSNREMASTNATGGDTGSPVASVSTMFFDGSNPWASVVTDSENKVKKSYHDACGRVLTIIEVTGSGNFNTSYKYDLLGNPTNVTDNASNSTVTAYDSLGRKILMVDPDMGTWSYAYDNSGRLIQQIDARTNKLKFYFSDELGRMSSKEIYNAANQLVGTITYTYDSNGGDTNYTVFKGQLYKVTDLEGAERSSYDIRGRVLKTARSLKLNSMEYVTESTYDDADRVQTVVYPGNAATINYTYDTAGNLTQVKSLAGTGTQETFYSSPTFNEMGQLTSYTYGNGVVTTNSYYANSRRAQHIRAFKGTTNHQDLTYTFDKVSNLKSLTDGVYSSGASGSLTNIAYDDLHRLTSLNSTARGSKTYSYDSIGNTLVNQDYGTGTYVYGSRPHAVTNANSKTYSYDACGNMVTRGTQALIYDEENQLIQAGNVRFGYADGGGRLWRSGTNGYSVWIGGIYEINNGKVLCHVFAGGRRVASFEPRCGGPWAAKVVGEERYYAYAGILDEVFNWPFREGRTPYTMLALAFGAMLCVVLIAGRGTRLNVYEVRKLRQRGLIWKQAVTFASIAALILTTTQNVEAQVYPTVFHYYHADHLGSSNVLTDRAGYRMQHYEYAAFGKATYTEDAAAFPVSHRYTGQVLDEETGLCYYNARYYDPELGRFTQADTIVPSSNPQTLNRYAYCGNNPLKYVDPSGHDFGIGLIIIAVVVGAVVGGATAAATGGNIGMGILTGAIGGLFGGVGAGIGSLLGSALAGAIIGGAAGGAISAAITGGDVGMGALTGAIAGGIGFCVGQIHIPVSGGAVSEELVDKLVGFASSAAGGSVGAGVGSVLQGGDFWDGAIAGAIGGAIGYAVATEIDACTQKSEWTEEDNYAAQDCKAAYGGDGGLLSAYKMKYSNDGGFSPYLAEHAGKFYLSFAGTDPKSIQDWINNGGNLIGMKMSQYKQAVDLAQQVVSKFGVDNVIIGGHSLGGGQGIAAGMATGARVITFNAAGVPRSWGALPPNVQNHFIIGEPLSTLQNATPFAGASGQQIPHWGRFLNQHSIDNFQNIKITK